MPRTSPRVRAYALAGLAVTGLAFTSLCGFAPHAQAEQIPLPAVAPIQIPSIPALPQVNLPSLQNNQIVTTPSPVQTTESTSASAVAAPVAETAMGSSALSSSLGLNTLWDNFKKFITNLAKQFGFSNLLPDFLRWVPPLTTTVPNSATTNSNSTTPTTTESTNPAGTSGLAGGIPSASTSNHANAATADSAAMRAELGNAGAASGTCSSTYTVSANRLVWGVKESFRSYIDGSIAKGHWDLNGTNYENGSFVWTGTTGSANSQDKSGVAKLNGGVHFTGHNGILDLTISSPEIVYKAGKGQLMATVVSNDMNGKAQDYGKIALANLSFARLTLSNGVLMGATNSVTLTDEGAKAFAGYYQAGEQLDQLTFASAMKDSCGGSATSLAGLVGSRSTGSSSSSKKSSSTSTTSGAAPTSAAPSTEAKPSEENQFKIKETPTSEANSDSVQAQNAAASQNIYRQPWLWVAIVIILVLVIASAVVRAKKKPNHVDEVASSEEK
ncbi:MAG: HtaA domain-containing protein [Corynebacterium sp.]|nr:HtaA domain-containing protein [Corynebacterium sp.]